MKNSTVKKIDIHEIKPYWRNPRDNAEAVEKVKKSIQDYGYNQLICVDKDNVIIAGHTRYKALLDLGYGEIDVLEADLTPKEAKAYRIIDNKTSEYANWNDNLSLELRELLDVDLTAFFDANEMDLGLKEMKEEVFAIDTKKSEMDKQFEKRAAAERVKTQTVMCPSCAHEFDVLLNQS